jgi:predicted lipid-binding transport protein (Tim44 family)
MKKLLAALLTASLVFSPLGNVVFQDHTTTVEAKGYKSGKKGFNNNNNSTNNNSIFQQKKDNTTKSPSLFSSTTKKKSGGFMKGLMVGGLAGLLFGSLFANMGFLGSILGFLINMIAIIFLISIIRKVYVMYKNKKRREDSNPWTR